MLILLRGLVMFTLLADKPQLHISMLLLFIHLKTSFIEKKVKLLNRNEWFLFLYLCNAAIDNYMVYYDKNVKQ